MSFPRSYRLTTKAEYKSVFDKSYKINHQYLLILSRLNHKPHARLGLIIGKRVAKSAVIRNRVKRILRESFRLNQKELKAIDIVIIARQKVDTLSNQKLREYIDLLWKKLLIS